MTASNNDRQKAQKTCRKYDVSPIVVTLEDTMAMMFMVPRNINKEELPRPNNPSISFNKEPSKTVAAIRFSGWANSERIEKFKSELMATLDASGIGYTQNLYYLGYDPLCDVVNRRNEVIVELIPKD